MLHSHYYYTSTKRHPANDDQVLHQLSEIFMNTSKMDLYFAVCFNNLDAFALAVLIFGQQLDG